MRQLITFSLLLHAFISSAGFGIRSGLSSLSSGNVYVISIGVDKDGYEDLSYACQYCKSDAVRFTDYVSTSYYSLPVADSVERGQVFPYTLTNETATYEMVKAVFRDVARKARPQDHLIIFYAGLSFSDSLDGYLLPYCDVQHGDRDSFIAMHTLSSWMESITCENQLLISEAGNGQDFAMDLMSSLFENNARIAEENERNRILLTTHDYGREGAGCGSWYGGYLLKFIHASKNIFHAFLDPDGYNKNLVEHEFSCEDRVLRNGIYCRLYNEAEYRRLLIRSQLGSASRGLKRTKVAAAQDSQAMGRKYALLISTNTYGKSSNWENLRNPKRDAVSIAEVLRDRYGFETMHLHDQVLDSVLIAIKQLKRKVRPQDKVFLFIAGHGYYDEDHSDGFLAFSDARSTAEDINYHSYLQMAKLHTMLNHFQSRQLFVVFDVCFGASFEFSAADLRLPDYTHLQADQGLDHFIHRKDTAYISRIFMASGRSEVMDYWAGSRDHSPFAAKFISALQEEEEFFSPGKLLLYVEGNITEPVLKRFGKHQERADFLMPVVHN